jgi:hypothetical protein
MRDNEPDIPDDEGGGATGGNEGSWLIAVAGAIVALMVALSLIGLALSRFTTPPPTGTARSCTEECWGFVKLECPTHRYMGPCVNIWPSCSGTPHVCGTNP